MHEFFPRDSQPIEETRLANKTLRIGKPEQLVTDASLGHRCRRWNYVSLATVRLPIDLAQRPLETSEQPVCLQAIQLVAAKPATI